MCSIQITKHTHRSMTLAHSPTACLLRAAGGLFELLDESFPGLHLPLSRNVGGSFPFQQLRLEKLHGSRARLHLQHTKILIAKCIVHAIGVTLTWVVRQKQHAAVSRNTLAKVRHKNHQPMAVVIKTRDRRNGSKTPEL